MPLKRKREPQPRASNFMGSRTTASRIADTWLEPEELTYPAGGMTRRARALCPDGALRVVVCGLPDTAFSIPARARINGRSVRGFVSSDERGFHFTPYKRED
jgi:hypothetical protein